MPGREEISLCRASVQQTTAHRLGMSPLEFYQQHGAKIIGDDIGRRLGGTGEGFRATPEEVRAGDEALKRDSEAFAVEVNKVKVAKLAPQDHVIMLKQTPLVLKMIGKDVLSRKEAGSNGIFVSPHTFRNILNGTHTLTFDMLKQVPKAMADPIAIFDSASKRSQGDVVFMLEVKDANGATVVAPVVLRTKDQNRVEVDIVKSAYAKEDNGVPNNQWFKREVEQRARYVNEEKIKRWKDATGVQFPVGSLRNASGNRVRYEADLVKLRQANPALYQDASPTDAPAFKIWFGDSKVVDDAGEPLTLWHQTGADIEAFDPRKPGAGEFDIMKSGLSRFMLLNFKEHPLSCQRAGRAGWIHKVGKSRFMKLADLRGVDVLSFSRSERPDHPLAGWGGPWFSSWWEPGGNPNKKGLAAKTVRP